MQFNKENLQELRNKNWYVFKISTDALQICFR